VSFSSAEKSVLIKILFTAAFASGLKYSYSLTSTPNLPESFEYLTIYTANDIEKILYDLHLMILDMEENFLECGDIECMEV